MSVPLLLYSFMLSHTFYLLILEEFVVGFTVEFTVVSEVEVTAVKVDDGEIICVRFAACDAEGNTTVVDDAALGDPTVIVALGDTMTEIWPKASVIERTILQH